MIIGVTIHNGLTAYSPWFPRQGNAATFAMEVIGISGATLTVTVHTKNTEDADNSGTQAATGGSFSAVTTAPQQPVKRNYDLKELVRFQYVVTGSNAYDWVHFRMLPPAWEKN